MGRVGWLLRLHATSGLQAGYATIFLMVGTRAHSASLQYATEAVPPEANLIFFQKLLLVVMYLNSHNKMNYYLRQSIIFMFLNLQLLILAKHE